MKISYNWLKQYLNLDEQSSEIAELLTDIGLEVEGFEEISTIKGGLKGVVVGEVIGKEQHPNADRLSITRVDIGKDRPLQIVCGAPNVSVGQKVPLALVGTWLFQDDKKYKIKKSKIRGEVSEGMICGEDELGLGDYTDGIMILSNDLKVGVPLSDYFDVENDVIFDIGLTPNRSDAMSHIGVARDLQAALSHRGKELQMCIPKVDDFSVSNTDLSISVKVKKPEICYRYAGISLSNIKVSSSPDWLQNRLKSIGLKPINNIVDITNYVLHETGQPLHAFDYSKIIGGKIIVDTAQEESNFVTLDEQERHLSSEDLMISNDSEPMCIAGIMGGFSSGVNKETKQIFLESACFSSASIRRSAKRHTLNTDASFRFERGVDPNMTIYALKRAVILIQEVTGAIVSSEILDIYSSPKQDVEVLLLFEKLDSLIGEQINREKIKKILINLGFDILKADKLGLKLKVPSYRVDVTRDVDVIEEILRIYGYNEVAIPTKLLSSINHKSTVVNSDILQNSVSNFLISNGFFEIMNNSLTKQSYSALIPELSLSEDVEMINPLSRDVSLMRRSMIFGGLESIAYNQNRKQGDLKLFEFGKTYHLINDKYDEIKHLQIFLSGKKSQQNWLSNDEYVDFFDIKKYVENLLVRIGVKNIKYEPFEREGLVQALRCIYKKKTLVCFGQIDSSICNSFGVNVPVFSADFNWAHVLDIGRGYSMKYQELSKYPSVRRDLSLILDKKISFSDVEKVARISNQKLLREINLFDVYEGGKLLEGQKSYSISFLLSDYEKTLTDKQIDEVMLNLIEIFEDKLNAKIRS